MKKVLLAEESEHLHYYRANLHCHSNISDGKKTPEELKRDYKAQGYSILCCTDHEIFIPHNDLTEPDFLMLNGTELSVNDKNSASPRWWKTCHICMVAKEPDNFTPVCWHRTRYYWGNAVAYADMVQNDPNEPDYVREYSAEGINDIMRRGREAGFFVTYNHPVWSLESYPEYMGYTEMDALEIYNHGCIVDSYEDDNGLCYNDLLNDGRRIFCTATDDNHNHRPDEDPRSDSYGGYIMIAAPKLEYRAVTKALEEGNFYSSTGNSRFTGPTIRSIVYEDGKLTVKAGNALSIGYIPSSRDCHLRAGTEEEGIEEATFTVQPDEKWFRVVVKDQRGFKAYSNAYFPDEF